MAGVSLSGMASGLDTNAIVAQLMAIERQPLTRLDATRLRAEGRRTALDDIATKLRALMTAQTALSAQTASTATVQKIDVSDPTRVGARVASPVTPGGYVVQPTRLASAQMSTFDYDPPNVDQGVDVTIDGTTISLPAGRTALTDVAAGRLIVVPSIVTSTPWSTFGGS